ncbi:MAG: MFS transporter [Proteobacteria bacterium]|nr:MFS transporter [Pseudomonadota bacterium]
MELNLSRGRRIADTAAMLVVAAVSLLTLIYIAFGEARRNYEHFQIEKLVSQGQVVQSAVETFVRPGLPMHQFVGFATIVDSLVEADPLIDNIAAYGATGERVFSSVTGAQIQLLPASLGRRLDNNSQAEVRQTSDQLQVVLPIKNRFETVGSIVLSSPRGKVASKVEEAFRPLAMIAASAALVFTAYVFFISQQTDQRRRARAVAIAFALQFILVSVFVVHTLLTVYNQGAQSRAKAIADSLAQRLDDVVAYGLSFDEFTGVIALVDEYKRLNPEIRSAALTIGERLRAHSNPVPKEDRWISNPSDFEYSVVLTPSDAPVPIRVVVAMPKDVVYKQVIRSGKNFVALFVACALIAALFMGVARSLQYVSAINRQGHEEVDLEARETATLNLVKPVFFLAVFVEHLNYAFLPQLMHELTAQAGYSMAFASLPFLAYYLFFALSLVPAGRLDANLGSRKLIIAGMLMAGLGIFMLSTMRSIEMATLARAVAGLGQGTLFIGVQAYVLANSSANRKTRAGAAIVFGFQAGMIAGMAIGSLLVSYIDAKGVFQLGTVIALVTTLYSTAVLPQAHAINPGAQRSGAAWRDVGKMLTNGPFLRAMMLIGVPAKAVLTGVVLFSLPMLLTKQGYAREDIGQFTMLYAGAVILASSLIASYADRSRQTERILVMGGVLTSLGLVMMSLVSTDFVTTQNANPFMMSIIIAIGVSIIGIAHGFINAPVVTHVAESRIAAELGVSNVASTYRLVERFGHMLGPVLMGQAFLYFGASWETIGWVGAGVLLLTVLFPSAPENQDSAVKEHAVT